MAIWSDCLVPNTEENSLKYIRQNNTQELCSKSLRYLLAVTETGSPRKISLHHKSILWFYFLLLDLQFQPHKLAGALLLVRQRFCRRAVYLKACTNLPTTTPWFLLAVLTSSFLKQQNKRSWKHLRCMKNLVEGEGKRQSNGWGWNVRTALNEFFKSTLMSVVSICSIQFLLLLYLFLCVFATFMIKFRSFPPWHPSIFHFKSCFSYWGFLRAETHTTVHICKSNKDEILSILDGKCTPGLSTLFKFSCGHLRWEYASSLFFFF